jgi:hypothetical protein
MNERNRIMRWSTYTSPTDGRDHVATTEVPGAKLTALVADVGTLEGTQMATTDVPSVDILVNNLGV